VVGGCCVYAPEILCIKGFDEVSQDLYDRARSPSIQFQLMQR
jgi:hypothetical protein